MRLNRMLKYGMIEYVSTPIEWRTSLEPTYALDAFQHGCISASKLSILDIYLDCAYRYSVPFIIFLKSLTAGKSVEYSCPFELLDTNKDEVNKELEETLKKYCWKEDTLEAVNKEFDELAKAHPYKK